MSLLPEIKDGKLEIEEPKLSVSEAVAQFKMRHAKPKKSEEDSLEELNNMGHKEITEDFEDSPHADRQPIKEDESH